MDDADIIVGIIVGVLAIAVIAFVIYVVVMIASIMAAVACGAGVLWGGGTAVVNYGKSFKENMIDSNIAA